MKADEFLGKLMADYKIPENLLKDLREYLLRFLESDLDKLWDAFHISYSYKKPPEVPNLNKIAESIEIKPRQRRFLYFICTVCKTRYSFTGRGCPVCREMTQRTVGISESRPSRLVDTQQDCWMCKHYSKYALGPGCREYGQGPVTNRQECGGCVCRKCCDEARIYRENPGRYRLLFDSRKLEDRYANKEKRHEKKEQKAG